MLITWLGHSAFRISTKDKAIYIDPFQIGNDEEKADIVFLTHIHHDHTSPMDIKKIQKQDTIFVTSVDSFEAHNVRVLRPGESEDIDGIKVEAVPAYNIGKEYHPKDKDWIGFIITIEGKRIYHTGDTDLIPEMDKIKADICLMPVSGIYVMTAEEAARAASKISPKLAIPMHYGSIVGSDADAEIFRERLHGKVEVKILKKGDSVKA